MMAMQSGRVRLSDETTQSGRVRLNDGTEMPLVGLGTFQGSYDYKSTTERVIAATESAIDSGYRHVDTAWLYNTEEGVGIAIKNKIEEGVVSREQMFVTSKLWCTSHRQVDVVPALKRTLDKLQLSYVDNWLVHWPIAMPPGESDWPKDGDGNTIFEDDKTSLADTWRGMEECKRLGLAKTIGLSNFNEAQIDAILSSCSIKPTTNQVEANPYFANRALGAFCTERGITMIAYSPLGKPHRAWAKDNDPVVFTDPVLNAIGQKYNKSAAQIALKFQVQRGVAVVPKSASPDRQKQNIDIFDFQLSDEDIAEICMKCDKHERVLTLKPLLGASKQFPF